MKVKVVSYFGKWYWWGTNEDGTLSLRPAAWLNG